MPGPDGGTPITQIAVGATLGVSVDGVTQIVVLGFPADDLPSIRMPRRMAESVARALLELTDSDFG